MSEQGKPPSASAVEQNVYKVFPNDLNSKYTVFGGLVMSLCDRVALIVAERHSGLSCVTAAVDSLHFVAPARAGDTLLIIANTEQNVSLHHAIQTAEQRQIKVVLLNCNRERWWDQAPTSNRIEIYTPIASPALAQQLHLLAVQTICELVEFKLFGE